MRNYGRAAELAAQMLSTQKGLAPAAAWELAVRDIFFHSTSSQKKGCPKNAFLALCEIGVVKNVASGNYTQSVQNKAYVIRALDALRREPSLSENQRELWRIATDGANKIPNGQIEVLVALFRSGFVV